ncbi:MAG TPA: ATP synthase F1 subunit delta, partial [Hanamia sp.]|nr:ATP synthase F1 subunit delta [Hanamia sp.]
NNPRLARRYAKSLIDISTDMKQLDAVHNDILFLSSVVKMSHEFILMLNSPIIHPDKKYKIISAVAKGKISKITDAFLKLLCNKNRESNLPDVIISFIEQYNTIRGLHNAKLTTAAPASKELIDSFISKIKASTSYDNVELETLVDDKIIGGFILQMEGKLIDNSIRRNLNDVKKQFANNDYLHRLR